MSAVILSFPKFVETSVSENGADLVSDAKKAISLEVETYHAKPLFLESCSKNTLGFLYCALASLKMIFPTSTSRIVNPPDVLKMRSILKSPSVIAFFATSSISKYVAVVFDGVPPIHEARRKSKESYDHPGPWITASVHSNAFPVPSMIRISIEDTASVGNEGNLSHARILSYVVRSAGLHAIGKR